jgi:DmsE family decaheme c-type cytochrome
MRATLRTLKVKPWRALLVLWLGSLPLATVGAEQAAGVSEEPAEFMGADICESCHEDIGTAMRMNPHGQSADPRTPSARDGCESCHGPGSLHVEADGESSAGMLGFHPVSDESTEHQNAACLACHQEKHLMHWQASAHDNEDTACSSCHTVHLPDRVLERSTQAEVCYGCHRTIRSQTYQASTHPIRAGKVVCSDCHNAHGGMGPAELTALSINDNCYACHAEKRGPFLWEHYPATEDCSLCHRVHGSIHPYLLTRQGPQLCQQCHEDIRAQGRQHVRRFFDFDDPDAARDRFIVGLNCMNCHSQVHGSNHPSGAYLLR